MENSKIRFCPTCKKQITHASKYVCADSIEKNKNCAECNYKLNEKRNKKNSVLTSEDEEIIISFLKEGFTHKEIVEKINFKVKHAQICRVARRNGFSRIFSGKFDPVDENHGKCRQCNLVQELNQFRKTNYNSYNPRCKNCLLLEWQNKLNTNKRKFFSVRVKAIKRRCITKNIKFNIDVEYILFLFEKQEGKCFYTNDTMVMKAGIGVHKNHLSIDRLIPDRGYVKGNIVLCLLAANSAKSDLSFEQLEKWFPDWHQKIQKFLEEVNNQEI